MRPRFRRDLLVWHTGILVDPNAIGVRCGQRIGLRGEPRRDLLAAPCSRATADVPAEAMPSSHSRNAGKRRKTARYADDSFGSWLWENSAERTIWRDRCWAEATSMSALMAPMDSAPRATFSIGCRKRR